MAKKKQKENQREITKEEVDYANEIFSKLLRGEDLTQTVKSSRGEFVFRYPTNGDKIEIERLKSAMLENVNIEKADGETLLMISAIASIDVCLVTAPKWWKGAKACPDRYLLGELYRGFLQRCIEVQEVLRVANVGGDDRESSNNTGSADVVGSRAFPVFTDRQSSAKSE